MHFLRGILNTGNKKISGKLSNSVMLRFFLNNSFLGDYLFTLVNILY